MASADVVNHQKATCPRGFAIHDDADVRDVATQIPRNQITGSIVGGLCADGQDFAFACKERHQIGHAPVIYVGVRMRQKPAALIRIGREVPQHVLVDLFLQIDTDGAVRANDFISAHTSFGRDIAVRIWDAPVSRIVAHDMVRAFYSGSDQPLQELRVRRLKRRWALRQSGQKNQKRK